MTLTVKPPEVAPSTQALAAMRSVCFAAFDTALVLDGPAFYFPLSAPFISVQAQMLCLWHDLEILGAIVRAVVVDVMNMFIGTKPPTKNALHDRAVLSDVVAIGAMLKHIARRVKASPALPSRRQRPDLDMLHCFIAAARTVLSTATAYFARPSSEGSGTALTHPKDTAAIFPPRITGARPGLTSTRPGAEDASPGGQSTRLCRESRAALAAGTLNKHRSSLLRCRAPGLFTQSREHLRCLILPLLEG